MEGRTGSVFSGARLPPAFFNGMMTSFSISSVVDMTPGQGPLLQTCLDLRVPALAICLSDTHCSQHIVCKNSWTPPTLCTAQRRASSPPKTANGKKRRTRRKKRNIDEPKGKKLKKKKGDDEEETSKKKKGKTASRKVHHRRTTKKTRRRKRKNKRRKAALLATRGRGEIADRLEPRDFQSVGVDPRREGTC